MRRPFNHFAIFALIGAALVGLIWLAIGLPSTFAYGASLVLAGLFLATHLTAANASRRKVPVPIKAFPRRPH